MRPTRRTALLFGLLRRLPIPMRAWLFHLVAPKITVGASAVIWDEEGRVLLVHHTYRRDGWGFPSGLVRRREQPAAALTRELHEELSVEAEVVSLLHAQMATPVPHLTIYYAVRLHGIPRHDGTEVDDQRFAALEELPALTGAPPSPWLLDARGRRASVPPTHPA